MSKRLVLALQVTKWRGVKRKAKGKKAIIRFYRGGKKGGGACKAKKGQKRDYAALAIENICGIFQCFKNGNRPRGEGMKKGLRLVLRVKKQKQAQLKAKGNSSGRPSESGVGDQNRQ